MKRLFCDILIVILLVGVASGQIPQTISYQGVLADMDGVPAPDGVYNIAFKIFDAATGGNELWTEEQSVNVVNGIFNVILGSVKPLSPGFDRPYWLALKLGDGLEMAPRTAFTASAYALNARSIAPGAVTSDKIDSGQVVKSINLLKDNISIVAGEHIRVETTGNVIKIKSTVVSNAGDITAVTPGIGLVGGGQEGDVALALNLTYTDGRYVNEGEGNSVTQAMIQSGAVGNSSLADNSVTASKVVDGEIGSNEIANGAVTSGKILDGQVMNSDLANNAITSSKIATGNVVKSINTLKDDVTLVAGSNVIINPAGNTLTISATSSGDGYSLDAVDGNPVDAVYVDTEGNVGVGTKVPSDKLEVNGNAVVKGEISASTVQDKYLKLRSSLTQSLIATDNLFVRYGDTAGSSELVFREGGQERMRIAAGGNVGIGVTNPGDKLSVAGIIESRSGGFKFPDGTIQNTASRLEIGFIIDHPLQPTNKNLYHAGVQSIDMMNIYNGNAILDANGAAIVELPEWFEALNGDFRYQLTCIGGFAGIYIAEEIANNRFKIAGGTAGLKVSWQVTGIRRDALAEKNRVPVEVEKQGMERGKYLHPEAFGQPASMGVNYDHKE